MTDSIGAGGMGQVWAGLHPPTNLPVAVKIIRKAPTPARRRAFANEVRAIAGMNHPNILQVFDQGVISAEEAGAWPLLSVGSPWMAMERAVGAIDPSPMPWPQLRAALRDLLAALAHAHARGIVHLDIKPSNVLQKADGRLCLADFGIAQLRLVDDSTAHAAPTMRGSPQFMAPEQFASSGYDFTPATDLYALGGLAYVLASGLMPFPPLPLPVLRQLRSSAPPPKLPPSAALPSGLSGWIQRLMAPDPAERFPSAAVAARALEALEPPAARPAAPAAPVRAGGETFCGDTSLVEMTMTIAPAGEEPGPSLEAASDADGVGLGVYGIRALPMIGRRTLRQWLLRAAERVSETGEGETVLLDGALGVGKSELARWLVTHVREHGTAAGIAALHAQDMRGGGIWGALRRHIGCTVASEDEIVARLEDRLGGQPALARAAARRMVGLRGAEDVAWAASLLRALAAREPVVVWMDDVHEDPAAIALVERLARRPVGSVLVVATTQHEALAEIPAARAALEALRALPSVSARTVLPLDPGPHRQLVTALLDLDGDWIDLIAARTAGNPLFAIQLVGDWIRRRILRATPAGFVRDPDAPVSLPEDLQAVCDRHLEHLLGGRADAVRDALERAVVLGPQVRRQAWREACAAELDGLEATLLDRALIRPVPDGWQFVHPMIAERLAAQARAGGRWAAHCAACVPVLRAHGVARGRLGRVLLDAGSVDEGAEMLIDGMRDAINAGQTAQAMALDRLARGALAGRGDAPAERLRFKADTLVAQVRFLEGRLGEAAPLAEQAIAGGRRLGEGRAIAAGTRLLSAIRQREGRFEEACALLEEATAQYATLGDASLQAVCLSSLAEIASLRGDLDMEARALESAGQLVEQLDGISQGILLLKLGVWQMRVGQDACIQTLTRGLRCHRDAGALLLQAAGHSYLGEAHSRRGADAAAEAQLAQARALFEMLGSPNTAVIDGQRAALLLKMQRPADALPLLESALVVLAANGLAQQRRHLQLVQARALLQLGRPGAAAEAVRAACASGQLSQPMLDEIRALREDAGERGAAEVRAALPEPL